MFLDVLSFLADATKSSHGLHFVVIVVITIYRLRHEPVGGLLSAVLEDATGDLATQSSYQSLQLKKYFVFVVFVQLAQNGILTFCVAAKQVSDPKLQCDKNQFNVISRLQSLD